MSTEFFNDQWRIPSNENQNKISNYSMEFDGVSTTNINVGNISAIQGASKFSISTWINLDSTGQQRIFGSWQASASKRIVGFGIHSNSKLLLQVSNDGISFDQLFSTTTLTTTGSWIHVAVTFSNGDAEFYIDGASAGSDTSSTVSNIYNISNDYFIGTFISSSTIPFAGKMDQLNVFDYALSQAQVTQLGAQGYAFASGGSLSGSIDLANPVALGTSKTVSFWFKLSSSATFSFSPFTAINNSGNCYYPYFISSSSTYKWYLSDSSCGGTGSFNLGSGGAVERNKWVHAAVVGNATNVKCYINGIKVNDDSNADRNPIIQRLIYGATQLIEFSNFSIFNTNLPETGTESISSLYNNGNPPDLTNYSNIIHWWKLDDADTFDGADWTVTDYIGSNTGTSNGMNASNLVASNINGELIANPMATSPKPVAYYQLGDQSVSTGPTSDYLVPNNSLSDYVFDFNTDSIEIPSSGGSFLNGATKLTVSIWVNLDASTGVDYLQVFAGNWINPGWQFSIRFIRYGNTQGPRIQFLVRSGSGGGTAQRSFDPAGVGWFNITGTWDGSIVKVYTNGVAGGISPALTGTINNSNETIELGNSAGAYYLNGKLSNVAIWKNTALTQPEVTEVYNNGAPLNLNNFSGSAPAAWYKLNASEIFNSTSTEWSVDNNAYPSVYKSSLDFNGNNDQINCGNNASLTFGNGTADLPFSVSFWINPDVITGGTKGYFQKGTDSLSEYGILFTSQKIRFRLKSYNEANNNFQISIDEAGATALVADSWNHVAVTYDGTGGSTAADGMEMYINGNPIAVTRTNNGGYVAMSNKGSDLFIASRGGVGHVAAKFSNFSMFNNELDQAKVTTIYNNGTPEATVSHSPFSWWKLDNTVSGLLDSGSASNNGTNSGATEYAGFVNALAGESSGMDSSNLVVSDLQQTSGYSPYALNFDGANDQLTLSGIDSTGTKTYSSWIYPTVSSNNGGFLTLVNIDTDFVSIALWESEIHVMVAKSPTANNRKNTVQTISANQWYHIVVIKSTGSVDNIYINGVNQTLTTAGGWNAGNVPAQYKIGSASFPTTPFAFSGSISNVATFNAALNSTEITEIYNQGVPSNLNTFSGTKPTAWWQIGSNSSYNSGAWTCLDEIGTNNGVSAGGMTNDDIVNGVGYSANGLGTSTIDIKGDAPYSSANGLSENMDVLDRVKDVPG